jgi:hypothetical protein
MATVFKSVTINNKKNGLKENMLTNSLNEFPNLLLLPSSLDGTLNKS